MSVVTVSAPCRLHFGMFSFGRPDHPEFGGIGMMIEPPTIELNISPAGSFIACGDHVDRISDSAARLVRAWNLNSLPPCKIEVRSAPNHVGLGVGTQLGLSVAAGLRRYLNLPDAAGRIARRRRRPRPAIGCGYLRFSTWWTDCGSGQTAGRTAWYARPPDRDSRVLENCVSSVA